MSFIDTIKQRAKQNIKTIVLPEAEDIRVLQATERILKEEFANVILVGDDEKANKIAKENGVNIEGVRIVNPSKSEKYEEYANLLYDLRKHKGMTIEEAKKIALDPVYYGVLMVKAGEADGLVSGAAHSTSDTLRPALQILKTAEGTKLVSAFFLMVVPNCKYGDGNFVFADCGLNANPSIEELEQIAISSAKSYRQLVQKDPKIAMLSYSTYGSAVRSELTEKTIQATNLIKTNNPDLDVDGELQLDAAIVPEVAKSKAPGSKVAGQANVLVFPDLNAGNIGYKLVQRMANAEAYGPLCQGIAKPVNDLSRGCSSDDIVGVVAITALQAHTL